MIDKSLLRYAMDSVGISRQDLTELQGWSSTTYYRKCITGAAEWTVPEVKILEHAGVPADQIRKIFFDRDLL